MKLKLKCILKFMYKLTDETICRRHALCDCYIFLKLALLMLIGN